MPEAVPMTLDELGSDSAQAGWVDPAQGSMPDHETSVASRIEIGPRVEQQDRVAARFGPDGSWLMAVCDGLGGHPRGDEAAEAAISSLPRTVRGRAEAQAAVQAANSAVCALVPGDERGLLMEWELPMTTMCLVAWTPGGGLCGAWVGDSAIFVLPGHGCHDERLAWSSSPHGGWSGHAVNSTLGWHTELSEGDVGWFTDRQIADTMRVAAANCALIIAATDGLYEPFVSPYARHEPAAQFGEVLSDADRASADLAAEKLISAAAAVGLRDNAAVAVVRIRHADARRHDPAVRGPRG